jgi:hypothetical protein
VLENICFATTWWRRTLTQYLRQASLHAANGRVSNAIAALPIFPYYSFDLETLYGAVDGQQFGVERPTVKARLAQIFWGRLRKRKIEHAKVGGDAGFRFTALPGAAFRYTGRAAMSRATC